MGFSNQPDYQVQQKIYTGFAGASANRDPFGRLAPTSLQTYLNTLGVVNPTVVSGFFSQFFNGQPMPSKVDDFVSSLITYINANGGPNLTASATAIKTQLLNRVNAALMLSSPYADSGVMNAAVTPPVFTDINEQAFQKFIAQFQYTGTTIQGTPAGTSVTEQYFADRWNEFFFKLASVADTTSLSGIPNASGTMLNFQDVFTAYFGNNVTAFEQFLQNYIQEIVYPANGNGQSFIPSQDIGDWLEKVQQAYTISLKGSGAPLISSVGQTTRKVDILLSIFQLLVKMIGTLQKVAAAQSDRLQLLATWTGSYTNLQTQVPTFTAGDGTIFGGAYGNNANATNVAIHSRDDANSLNQTFTETIRSRRTQVDNASKSMQNNLNQSNDTANQQSDAATTILQNLRTILNALFK